MFIGSTTFHGDVSDKTNSFMNNTPFSKYFYQDRKFGGGVYVDKMFTPYWGVRGTLLYAKMKSTKESSKIYFEGDLFEYSISGLIDFSNIFLGVDKYRVWNFYGFIGVGFTETRSILYDSMARLEWLRSVQTGHRIPAPKSSRANRRRNGAEH